MELLSEYQFRIAHIISIILSIITNIIILIILLVFSYIPPYLDFTIFKTVAVYSVFTIPGCLLWILYMPCVLSITLLIVNCRIYYNKRFIKKNKETIDLDKPLTIFSPTIVDIIETQM